jgi:hypothetical protein
MPESLEDPPLQIAQQVDHLNALGSALIAAGRFSDAYETYRRLYEIMLGEQPETRRWHKGLPLANMGLARIRQGLSREGLKWMLLAFIEDALSRGEKHPHILDELQMPAAHNLRIYGLSESRLREMALRIRGRLDQGVLVHDPIDIFIEDGYESLLPEAVQQGRRQEPPPERIVVRVLVSSPGDLRPERLVVAEVCLQLGQALGFDVVPLMWEGGGSELPQVPPFPPEMTGGGAQAVINDRLTNTLGGYDIYLGLVWRRMGTPTEDWDSGTQAEFEYALASRSRIGRPETILFYWKQEPDPFLVEPRLNVFINRLQEAGFLLPFITTDELRRLVFDHLLEKVTAVVVNRFDAARRRGPPPERT